MEIVNEEIEKIRIGKFIEHCSLCNVCLMPKPDNCDGVNFEGKSYHCVKCDCIVCEECLETHNKLCDGLKDYEAKRISKKIQKLEDQISNLEEQMSILLDENNEKI